ncbi:MAG: 50S ribosomal protein L7/L12 [Candidatus Cloacimonadia bacterium]
MAEVSTAKDKVMELIKKMNVMELAELVKALEEEFGVFAVAPVATGAPAAAGQQQAEEEEKTEFDVILKSPGDKKIQVIKVVRQITKLGLKESKALVDEAPKPIAKGVSKEEAEKIKQQIEAEGGIVEIK